MGKSMFTSIVLTWSAPQEPNGVIISYEVTYRVNDGNPVTSNTTALNTTFTISSLSPGTSISNISVSAYTSVGRGEAESTSLRELYITSIMDHAGEINIATGIQ